ncbi:MAG: phosphoglucosamine mutase, partial [Campylobacteraceae bacterium]|nr:phosphoglucosamine mutase [Campylobacteraceae bacterium]
QAGGKLDAYTAMKLAMAAGIFFRKKSVTNKILVGKDTRRSGYMIENAIVSGLTAIGYNVIQIGPMPTPAVAFLTEDMRCDAGIMISASHNPYYDNGIKFFDHSGFKLDKKDEQEIEDIYFNDELIKQNQKICLEVGTSKRIDDVIGRYIVHIKNSFPKELTLHKTKVVLDVANGAAYKVAPTIFEELGAKIVVINDEPNGENINLNSGALHPQNLSKAVIENKADIGFAFDGDADRLVVVDEKGKVINGDELIGALANHLKKQNKLKEDCVVVTLMSNQGLEDFLNSQDIAVKRCSVGDKYVLEELKKCGSNFGGEESGHIIFSDYAKTGDGLVAALQVMAYILTSNGKASEKLNNFKHYPRKITDLKIKKRVPFEEIDGYEKLLNSLKEDGTISLIRYSGTEDLLRILLERKEGGELLDNKMSEVVSFFEKKLNA